MTEMTEARAREILGAAIMDDSGLCDPLRFMFRLPGDAKVTLGSRFTAEELKAIAFWMEKHAS